MNKLPYSPPYTITDAATNLIADIVDQLTRLELSAVFSPDVHLRKDNRLRSIHSSLAIENNSLSLEQVTDVVNGRRVHGNPREILEVKNAFSVYAKLNAFRPFSVSDFLEAHGAIMADLVQSSGHFRMAAVGVYAGRELIHAAPPHELVRSHVRNLFSWAAKTKAHPLVKSSVMHYEIEFIHPFLDGNGRMGRLWQSIVLANWNPLFATLPVETIIYRRQKTYYETLRQADASGEATLFIEFMLQAILDTIKEQLIPSAALPDLNTTQKRILALMLENGRITVEVLATKLKISSRAVQKNISDLKRHGHLKRIGAPKNGRWEVQGKVQDKVQGK